ncbi:hypothetical protein TEA_010332 [Camellia sinensis var. sinensis]|uniref:Eukaryotic translation initiation factor 2A n=1 Tax=Camellia sinensis var. sinensis TaxID=542762 RepID=A0A4V3WM91_CAMSN|nr:hypothetical protein TEA_010332 [Camellia sinensis var. sinensis]
MNLIDDRGAPVREPDRRSSSYCSRRETRTNSSSSSSSSSFAAAVRPRSRWKMEFTRKRTLRQPVMAVVDPSPSLEILVRGPEGFTLWTGPPYNNGQPSIKIERVPCTSAKFSEDGSKLMVIKSDSIISIHDCKSSKEIRSFEVPNILAATLSPRGTYLQTFQKVSSPQEKNVILWKTETGDSVYRLFQKNMTKTTWPSIRFSSDEAIACRLATNEIQFFDGWDFSTGIINRLRVPGVAAVELSKNPGSHVAAFVPESKGIPASVQVFACGKDSHSQPVARRSFFRCSTVQLNWNSGSTGLLIVVQSDVDKTNQSYYGESKLHYLTTDGSHDGVVPLRKEGPVHDVQWSCSGSEFAVVYGFMPARATVFDKKCNALLELGSGPYNTIRWNPKGKFLCVAGFGNLPGDMAFWDYMEKRQLGTTKAECSVTSEWSPDGCYFMTATTAPRLQVDNGIQVESELLQSIELGLQRIKSRYLNEQSIFCTWVQSRDLVVELLAAFLMGHFASNNGTNELILAEIKIFHYNGSLYFKKMFDKLYQAEWKPESPDRFGDIAELVKSIDSLKVEETKLQGQGSKSSQSSAKAASANPPTQKPAAYRPPHAKTADAIQAELFGGGATQEMSKNALKNKKKREKQREKKAADAATSVFFDLPFLNLPRFAIIKSDIFLLEMIFVGDEDYAKFDINSVGDIGVVGGLGLTKPWVDFERIEY